MSQRTVVVIGAGPGGLAASLLLAHAGCDVTIVERRETVGGRTSTIEQDGFRFDLGPTFFHYPRVLGDVFKAIGRDLFDEIPMEKLDPQYTLRFGNTSGPEDCLEATSDLERMTEQIRRFSPEDADGFPEFIAENRAKLKAFRPILESPFNSPLNLLKSYVFKALPWLRPTKSVDGDLKRYFSDPRLRIAFSFQSKYLGMSPYRCPSLFSILSFLEYEYGIFHPIGGCGAITRRMAEIAEEMGVTIRRGEPVEKLILEGGKAKGVVTSAGEMRADAVVLNADFAHAMRSLVPDENRKRWTNAKLAKKRYSCSTFMLYLGVDGQYDMPHHLISIADDYDKNLTDIENDQVLSADPSYYVQNACVTDPTLAPDGQSTLYVLVPVTHKTENVDWSVEAPRFRERVLDKLEAGGFPGLRERIVTEKILTPTNWEETYHIHKGAVFNLAHNLGQMLHLRPKNRFDDVPGMYLVGGGTHPGSGLPVIFESARITSKLMLDDFGMEFPGPAEPLPEVDEQSVAEVIEEIASAT